MIELKRVIDKSTIIVIDRSSRQKINKDRVDGNGTINQLDLFDIYPSTNSRIHILLKLPWRIHQDRPHSGS